MDTTFWALRPIAALLAFISSIAGDITFLTFLYTAVVTSSEPVVRMVRDRFPPFSLFVVTRGERARC